MLRTRTLSASRQITSSGDGPSKGRTGNGSPLARRKTPMQTFLDAMPMAKEKMIVA